MRFTRSWCSMLVRMVGVCPRGAQVRLSGETSENPLSSRKTRVAPRACHFFYMRPDIAFPMRNRFIIALQRTSLRFLATPPQTLQKIPDTARAIPHTKQIPDQVHDTIQGPVIFGVAVGIRSAPEGTFQAPELGGGQAAGRSGSTPPALALRLFRFLWPTLDTPFRRADPFGYLLGAQTASQQVSGTLAATRQLFARSVWSHAPNYRTS